ncbi:MAG: dATP/dGTP diphosphohydrolase domain-containing protein [Janthinobacterium lividum]
MISQKTPLRYGPTEGPLRWFKSIVTAKEFRLTYPAAPWTRNPWSGEDRQLSDIDTDPYGLLIVPPGEDVAAAPPRNVSAPLEHDPSGLAAATPGAKLDAGKTRVWLCVSGFSRALDAVAQVTTVGAAKYSPNGWMHVADGEARYLDAFGRHALKLGTGERIDEETGALHKAQMIWNLLASLELELRSGVKP